MRQAFSHLVISDAVIDQLGPAINAGHSMFVYGPPGNGKTVISEAIHNLLEGEIAIPYALEVEGSIVRLFDPVNHEPVATEEDHGSLASLSNGDRRWVRCRRPMVMVGGELTLDALELSYNPTTGFYFYVPRKNIIELEIPVEQAATLIMSAGMIQPGAPSNNGNQSGVAAMAAAARIAQTARDDKTKETSE